MGPQNDAQLGFFVKTNHFETTGCYGIGLEEGTRQDVGI